MIQPHVLDCIQNKGLISCAQSGDTSAQDEVILLYTALVKSIVKRYLGRGVEFDDLYQIGCMGLLKAVKHFNFALGMQFTTYAVPCIAGEIKDHLRDEGSVKISRAIKRKSQRIKEIQNTLQQEGIYDPKVSDIAEKTGFSNEEIVFAMESSYQTKSFDEMMNVKDKMLHTSVNMIRDDVVDLQMNHIYIHELLGQLTKRERQLIVLRYFQEKTQQETAKMLQVSQVQISRIEHHVMQKLRLFAN